MRAGHDIVAGQILFAVSTTRLMTNDERIEYINSNVTHRRGFYPTKKNLMLENLNWHSTSNGQGLFFRNFSDVGHYYLHALWRTTPAEMAQYNCVANCQLYIVENPNATDVTYNHVW